MQPFLPAAVPPTTDRSDLIPSSSGLPSLGCGASCTLILSCGWRQLLPHNLSAMRGGGCIPAAAGATQLVANFSLIACQHALYLCHLVACVSAALRATNWEKMVFKLVSRELLLLYSHNLMSSTQMTELAWNFIKAFLKEVVSLVQSLFEVTCSLPDTW